MKQSWQPFTLFFHIINYGNILKESSIAEKGTAISFVLNEEFYTALLTIAGADEYFFWVCTSWKNYQTIQVHSRHTINIWFWEYELDISDGGRSFVLKFEVKCLNLSEIDFVLRVEGTQSEFTCHREDLYAVWEIFESTNPTLLKFALNIESEDDRNLKHLPLQSFNDKSTFSTWHNLDAHLSYINIIIMINSLFNILVVFFNRLSRRTSFVPWCIPN